MHACAEVGALDYPGLGEAHWSSKDVDGDADDLAHDRSVEDRNKYSAKNAAASLSKAHCETLAVRQRGWKGRDRAIAGAGPQQSGGARGSRAVDRRSRIPQTPILPAAASTKVSLSCAELSSSCSRVQLTSGSPPIGTMGGVYFQFVAFCVLTMALCKQSSRLKQSSATPARQRDQQA